MTLENKPQNDTHLPSPIEESTHEPLDLRVRQIAQQRLDEKRLKMRLTCAGLAIAIPLCWTIMYLSSPIDK